MWVILLLLAWVSALVSCGRLCAAAVAAGRLPEHEPTMRDGSELSLYETAFLAGGPRRVTDLTLVRMARGRRLLLAHTGFVTVVDPAARDDLERAVIKAIGPDGQARIPMVRVAVSSADAMTALQDRLTVAGLAVPAEARTAVTAGVRQVRLAGLLVLALGLSAAVTMPPDEGTSQLWGWFALPLVLISGCLVIAWIEVHPYTRWAAPAGQQLLARMGVPRRHRPAVDGPAADDDVALLTALAVRGPAVLPEPELRAALSTQPRS